MRRDIEKTLTIDGRSVTFKATAAIPRLYRMEYGRDIMQDMRELQSAVDAASHEKGPIPPKLLGVFEDMAYLMARHARPDQVTAKSAEEWLDQFGTFSIYQILPHLIDLWGLNVQTTVEARKNLAKVSGK